MSLKMKIHIVKLFRTNKQRMMIHIMRLLKKINKKMIKHKKRLLMNKIIVIITFYNIKNLSLVMKLQKIINNCKTRYRIRKSLYSKNFIVEWVLGSIIFFLIKI